MAWIVTAIINAALILGGGSIAIAIVRYQFLDIRMIARKGIFYGAIVTIFATIYLLTIKQVTEFFYRFSGTRFEFLETGLIILFIIVFQPVFGRVEEWIEKIVGRDVFDPFLRGYFDKFAFQSITTADFVAYLEANLLAAHPEIAEKVDIDEWINQPGLPEHRHEPVSDAFEKVEAQAARWLDGGEVSDLATSDWTTQHWLRFLRTLPDDLVSERMAELDRAFNLNRIENSSFFNFTYGAITNGDADFALAEAVDNLRNIPLSLVEWDVNNSQRADVDTDTFEGNRL